MLSGESRHAQRHRRRLHPDSTVSGELERGELSTCLDAFQVGSDGYFLYFPSRNRTEPKLRAFVEHFGATKQR